MRYCQREKVGILESWHRGFRGWMAGRICLEMEIQSGPGQVRTRQVESTQAKPRHLAPGHPGTSSRGLDGQAGSQVHLNLRLHSPLLRVRELGAQGVGVGLALESAAAGV